MSVTSTAESRADALSSVAIGLILCGIGFLCSAFLQWPGHVSYDGITVWYEARHAVHFSQHPPGMAFILHWLDMLVPGPGLYTVLQLAVLWSAAAVLIASIKPPVAISAALGAVLLLYPPVLALDGLVEKDILATHLAVLAILVASLPPANRLWIWLAAFALMAIATVIRYQFAVTTLVLIVMIWRDRAPRKAQRFFVGAVAFLVVFFVYRGAIAMTITEQAMPSANGANVGASSFARGIRKVLIYDIAGTVSVDQAVRLDVLNDAHVDIHRLSATMRSLYTPDHVDKLWRPRGAFEQLESIPTSIVFRQWLALAWDAPHAFVAHHLLTFGRLLGLHGVYDCFPIVTGIHQTPTDLARDLDAASYSPALSTGLLRSPAIPVSILFPPFLYAVICIALILLNVRGYVPAAAAWLSGAALLYELTFFALPQSCDTRYSYFVLLAAIFGTALSTAGLRRLRDEILHPPSTREWHAHRLAPWEAVTDFNGNHAVGAVFRRYHNGRWQYRALNEEQQHELWCDEQW